jgi:hypothetical protein
MMQLLSIPSSVKFWSSGELAMIAYHQSREEKKERGVDRWAKEAA